MGDTSNARKRREREGFFEKYIHGRGIDIGCGNDPLVDDCRKWDVLDGDAQTMAGELGTYDWVYSSHCLEHLANPSAALQRWWQLVKPGGHLIIVVPDEDLYEMGMWPSHNNTDHKTTWSVSKVVSWSPVSRNLSAELQALPNGHVVHVRLLNEGYDYSLLKAAVAHVIVDKRELAMSMEHNQKLTSEMLGERELRHLGFWPVDQTNCPFFAEASIEGIVRKL